MGQRASLLAHGLAPLHRCITGRSGAGLREAMLEAARLGQATAATAAQHRWDWPEALARRTVSLLQAAV